MNKCQRGVLTRDDGVAIPTVIGIMVVLSLLMLLSLAIVSENTPRARATQDKSAARSAAHSGARDFAARVVERGDAYVEAFVNDDKNPAVDADPSTPECDGPGQTISSIDAEDARFCYRKIPTPANSGEVKLEITGSAGIGDKRKSHKMVVTFAAGGGENLTKYSWFSDYNINDPDVANRSAAETAECVGRYRWQGRPKTCSRSTTLGKTLYGRYHSNDWWEIYGDVTFASAPITNAGPPPFYEPYWPNATDKLLGTPVTQVPLLKMPTNVDDFQKYVLPKHDNDSNTNRPGCLYEGQTKITLSGNKMSVSSPNTTNVAAHCPAHGAMGDIPPLVYIKRASNSPQCSSNQASGFFNASEMVPTGTAAKINYDGCLGTLAVEGQINGASVTLFSEDDTVITDDLTVLDKSTEDLIGIVASGFVWIHNPVSSMNPNVFMKPAGDRFVDASVTSLNRTILAQNAGLDPRRGALRSTGSMIMKYQALFGASTGNGIVTAGYETIHTYDERLNNLAPPFYVKPVSGQFGIVGISDVGGTQ